MMWLTTMNPRTRRLIKVMPEDAEATAQVFDLLLGDNLQGPQGPYREERLQSIWNWRTFRRRAENGAKPLAKETAFMVR